MTLYQPGVDVPYETRIDDQGGEFRSLDVSLPGKVIRFPFLAHREPPEVAHCRCVSVDHARQVSMVMLEISGLEYGRRTAWIEVEDAYIRINFEIGPGRWLGGDFSLAMARGEPYLGRQREDVKKKSWAEFCEYADELIRENQARGV